MKSETKRLMQGFKNRNGSMGLYTHQSPGRYEAAFNLNRGRKLLGKKKLRRSIKAWA